jgi:hypothetical protein
VLLGNGDGTFQAPRVLAAEKGYYVGQLFVGDFNGDGVPDLLVTQFTGRPGDQQGRVTVFLGNGDGTFRDRITTPFGGDGGYTVVGDFYGDGILDVASLNVSSPTVSVLPGNGDGTFGPAQNFAVGDSGYGTVLVAADFDGDGHLDLAVGSTFAGGNRVAVLRNNGDGSFGPPESVETRPDRAVVTVAVGDFNGDGRPDLFEASASTLDLQEFAVTVYLNQGCC